MAAANGCSSQFRDATVEDLTVPCLIAEFGRCDNIKLICQIKTFKVLKRFRPQMARRSTTNREIAGSNPAGIVMLFASNVHFKKCVDVKGLKKQGEHSCQLRYMLQQLMLKQQQSNLILHASANDDLLLFNRVNGSKVERFQDI